MSWSSALARTSLFAPLSQQALDIVAARCVHRTYRAGNVIFVQGEVGDRCFVVISGAIKISAYNPDGREAVLAVLGPGDVFGELSPFDQAPRSADASVIEDAEVLSLDGSALTEAISTNPDIGVALLRVISRRLRSANDALQDIAFFDVNGRVARRLADLADTHGVPAASGVAIDVPLSQESLAQMVGATRESVNKALASLRRRDLVTREGRRYVVPDVAALRDTAR